MGDVIEFKPRKTVKDPEDIMEFLFYDPIYEEDALGVSEEFDQDGLLQISAYEDEDSCVILLTRRDALMVAKTIVDAIAELDARGDK